ncbi:MAG TPA: hypothetical protein VI933_00955 [archaeon]|nr:hypothetical protein [archaeon]
MVAGCTASQLDLALKASPAANNFLSQYPNASISTILVAQGTVAAQIEEIKKECGPDFPLSSYYKTILTDPTSGTTLIVWMDSATYQVVCSLKKTAGGTPETTSTTTTLPATTILAPTTTTSATIIPTPTSSTTVSVTTTTSNVTSTTTVCQNKILNLNYQQQVKTNVDGADHTIELADVFSSTRVQIKVDSIGYNFFKGQSYLRGNPPISINTKDVVVTSLTDKTQDIAILEINTCASSCKTGEKPENKITLVYGQPVDASVNGIKHKIELLQADSPSRVLIKADGSLYSIQKSDYLNLGNPLFLTYVKDISYTSSTDPTQNTLGLETGSLCSDAPASVPLTQVNANYKQPIDVTIGGKIYTFELTNVNSTTRSTIKVDGFENSYTRGTTYADRGSPEILIFVNDTKLSSLTDQTQNSVTLFVGINH